MYRQFFVPDTGNKRGAWKKIDLVRGLTEAHQAVMAAQGEATSSSAGGSVYKSVFADVPLPLQATEQDTLAFVSSEEGDDMARKGVSKKKRVSKKGVSKKGVSKKGVSKKGVSKNAAKNVAKKVSKGAPKKAPKKPKKVPKKPLLKTTPRSRPPKSPTIKSLEKMDDEDFSFSEAATSRKSKNKRKKASPQKKKKVKGGRKKRQPIEKETSSSSSPALQFDSEASFTTKPKQQEDHPSPPSYILSHPSLSPPAQTLTQQHASPVIPQQTYYKTSQASSRTTATSRSKPVKQPPPTRKSRRPPPIQRTLSMEEEDMDPFVSHHTYVDHSRPANLQPMDTPPMDTPAMEYMGTPDMEDLDTPAMEDMDTYMDPHMDTILLACEQDLDHAHLVIQRVLQRVATQQHYYATHKKRRITHVEHTYMDFVKTQQAKVRQVHAHLQASVRLLDTQVKADLAKVQEHRKVMSEYRRWLQGALPEATREKSDHTDLKALKHSLVVFGRDLDKKAKECERANLMFSELIRDSV